MVRRGRDLRYPLRSPTRPDRFCQQSLEGQKFLLTSQVKCSLCVLTPAHEGVSLMTMDRTSWGRCLRIAWKTCLAILGALATGASAIRPAYGQHITRYGVLSNALAGEDRHRASNRVGGALSALGRSGEGRPPGPTRQRLAQGRPGDGRPGVRRRLPLPSSCERGRKDPPVRELPGLQEEKLRPELRTAV